MGVHTSKTNELTIDKLLDDYSINKKKKLCTDVIYDDFTLRIQIISDNIVSNSLINELCEYLHILNYKTLSIIDNNIYLLFQQQYSTNPIIISGTVISYVSSIASIWLARKVSFSYSVLVEIYLQPYNLAITELNNTSDSIDKYNLNNSVKL
jgi:hypothetical protein